MRTFWMKFGGFFLFFALFFPIHAQQSKISAADSLKFAKFADEINGIVNQDPKKAAVVSQKYISEAKKLKNDDYSGRGATLLCTSYLVSGEMEKAFEWHKNALDYFKKVKNNLWSGYANMNMGIILSQKYNLEKGLPFLLQSTKDFEIAKDQNMMVSAYTAIANAFHDFGNYKKGKEYANLALDIIQKSKNIKPSYQWQALSSLAINYDDNKEYQKATETHLQALKLAGNDQFFCSTYNNLGNTYKKLQDFSKSSFYLNLALKKAKIVQDDYQFATIYGNLADVERQLHHFPEANKLIDSTLYYSKKSGSPEKLIDAYDFAYQIKNDDGNYKEAAQYLKKYVSLKDSLLNADKAKIIYNFQEQYETEKKQKLIIAQKEEIAKRNYWLLMAFLAFFLVASFAYFLYKNYKNKQNQKLQKEIFRQKDIASKSLFEGEQQERIRIARDLHDGVGQMLCVVKMNLSSLEQENPLMKKSSDLVDQTIEEVRNISHNLIPEELNFGIYSALENLANKINASGTTKMEIDISDEVKTLKLSQQNELSIYRIVQEVVNNMVKHSGADLILLSMMQFQETMIISLKDNGKGVDEYSLKNSKGIGWKNINARIHLLDGKINVQSEKLSGTQIKITFPKNGK